MRDVVKQVPTVGGVLHDVEEVVAPEAPVDQPDHPCHGLTGQQQPELQRDVLVPQGGPLQHLADGDLLDGHE